MIEYKITEGDTEEGDLWITAFGWEFQIMRTDEGVIAHVWDPGDTGANEPVASTYAFDSERAT